MRVVSRYIYRVQKAAGLGEVPQRVREGPSSELWGTPTIREGTRKRDREESARETWLTPLQALVLRL